MECHVSLIAKWTTKKLNLFYLIEWNYTKNNKLIAAQSHFSFMSKPQLSHCSYCWTFDSNKTQWSNRWNISLVVMNFMRLELILAMNWLFLLFYLLLSFRFQTRVVSFYIQREGKKIIWNSSSDRELIECRLMMWQRLKRFCK